MNAEKKPKWDIGVTISRGKQAESLVLKYEDALSVRMQPDEFITFQTDLTELAARQAGQKEQLVSQKSKTEGQNEQIERLHETVISIRRLVRSAGPGPEISEAFGIGVEMSKTVSSVVAASNIVVTAYNANKEWSNKAGIIDADIDEITALQTALGAADDVQEGSKLTRKAATMDKNTLQRAVEDEITRLSALGIRVFEKSDPAIAQLFEDLIPN
jgi:hypothetical protein